MYYWIKQNRQIKDAPIHIMSFNALTFAAEVVFEVFALREANTSYCKAVTHAVNFSQFLYCLLLLQVNSFYEYILKVQKLSILLKDTNSVWIIVNMITKYLLISIAKN